MEQLYTIQEIADSVNAWCAEHHLTPANGQAGDTVTERNIRYYRTLGLVDAPSAGAGPGFGEKQRLQIMGIRLLQAQGLPLRRIRQLLYGRDLEELREITERGAREAAQRAESLPAGLEALEQMWRVIPLDEEFLVISRAGRTLSQKQKSQILEILQNSPQSDS